MVRFHGNWQRRPRWIALVFPPNMVSNSYELYPGKKRVLPITGSGISSPFLSCFDVAREGWVDEEALVFVDMVSRIAAFV